MKDINELARRAGLGRKHRILTGQDRAGLYKTIYNRRDVRGQFLPDPIPDDVLARVLNAAHHAPSVGFMQPWNFLVIRSREVRERVHAGFLKANREAARLFEGTRGERYRGLKLEGILDTPLNLCVTCDRSRSGPVVLGRTAQPNMDLYSTVCAVQNLWLAARAEDLGVGWVSIIHENELARILELPENVVPVAYLCVGYVTHFQGRPELESAGWRGRMPLDELIFLDRWGDRETESAAGLLQAIHDLDGF